MKIPIGKAGTHNVAIDLERLLGTRLLIQANSGKGKSWLIRLLAEQLFGKIPVIIVDAEGEFASLREKFGYVLVGKGGETPADTRSVDLVAHKLLELKASAVCDIYELKAHQRHAWVKLFLDAMIDAPKNLWHPCIVIVDEAHVFCPEKGAGESEASEAMISLATRGRKRGFCAIFATQRLGKLRKDAAAELVNVLIGGTFIDVDRKRAADTLGVYGKDLHAFFDEVKLLERGYFFALGPAISTERILVKVGAVETTHPEAGSAKHAAEPPPAPDAIAKMLPKLADLPKAAEEQAKTVAELKTEIRSLKAQLRSQPAGKPVEVKVADPRAIERAVKDATAKANDEMRKLSRAVDEQRRVIIQISQITAKAAGMPVPKYEAIKAPKMSQPDIPVRTPAVETVSVFSGRRRSPAVDGDGPKLKAGAMKMLTILAQWHPDPRTRDQLGALAGFAPTGGTFSEYLSALRTRGYIANNGEVVQITDEGLAAVPHIPERPNSPNALISLWKSKFKAGVGRMLDVLVNNYPNLLTREELGEHSGFAASGGTFSEYLSALRRARLIDEQGQQVRAAASLMEL